MRTWPRQIPTLRDGEPLPGGTDKRLSKARQKMRSEVEREERRVDVRENQPC